MRDDGVGQQRQRGAAMHGDGCTALFVAKDKTVALLVQRLAQARIGVERLGGHFRARLVIFREKNQQPFIKTQMILRANGFSHAARRRLVMWASAIKTLRQPFPCIEGIAALHHVALDILNALIAGRAQSALQQAFVFGHRPATDFCNQVAFEERLPEQIVE